MYNPTWCGKLKHKNSKGTEDLWISPRWLTWFQEESLSIWELLSACFQAVFLQPLRLRRGSTHRMMAHGLFFVFFLCEVFKWQNQSIRVYIFTRRNHTGFDKELIISPAPLWPPPCPKKHSIKAGVCLFRPLPSFIHMHPSKLYIYKALVIWLSLNKLIPFICNLLFSPKKSISNHRLYTIFFYVF